MEIVLAMFLLGFYFLAASPFLIGILIGLVGVTALIAFFFYRLQKAKHTALTKLMAKAFLILTCALLFGAVLGGIAGCLFSKDAFCIFPAAPFLSSALLTSLTAFAFHLVSNRKKPVHTPHLADH